MQTLSCPIPSNINPLQSNGFMFSIDKLPEIAYFCQEVSIPDLILPAAEVASPLVLSKNPGDKVQFGDLSVTFLVDGNMDNYMAIHNWIVSLGFPESWSQFDTYTKQNTNALSRNLTQATVSDGVLQILGSSNTPVKTVRFVDMFPTSLASIQLQSTTQDTSYIAGVATFEYTYYKFD